MPCMRYNLLIEVYYRATMHEISLTLSEFNIYVTLVRDDLRYLLYIYRISSSRPRFVLVSDFRPHSLGMEGSETTPRSRQPSFKPPPPIKRKPRQDDQTQTSKLCEYRHHRIFGLSADPQTSPSCSRLNEQRPGLPVRAHHEHRRGRVRRRQILRLLSAYRQGPSGRAPRAVRE